MTTYAPSINVPPGSVYSVSQGTLIATAGCNTASDGSNTSVGLVVISNSPSPNTIYCANFYCTIPTTGTISDVTSQTNAILSSYLPVLVNAQYVAYCTNSITNSTTAMASTTTAIINAITAFYAGIDLITFMGLTPGIYVNGNGACVPIEVGDTISTPLSLANNEAMITATSTSTTTDTTTST